MNDSYAAIITAAVTGFFGLLGVYIAGKLALSKGSKVEKPSKQLAFEESYNTFDLIQKMRGDSRATKIEILDEIRAGFDRIEKLMLAYDRARRQAEQSHFNLSGPGRPLPEGSEDDLN